MTIEERYLSRTPSSAGLMRRAAGCMPAGLTRSLSWFAPYPVVFSRGRGTTLIDLDGNDYVDMFGNGLSIIHGYDYEPIVRALESASARGTAWPGASDAQVAFAELLQSRLPGDGLVRFTNTGTEATMLAVRLAREVTGRSLIVKAWDAYHGSYEDLAAGLFGSGEIPGRVALARFGELETYEQLLDRHAGTIAAVVVEPVQYTGVVTPPPPGFLPALSELCRQNDVLLILDDCLMFRLAAGGSADRFGFRPDITCLGKWIGGGVPVGAIVASRVLMERFDPLCEHPIYHGGSFNGSLAGSLAGRVAVDDLTDHAIARIDGFGERLRESLHASASAAGVGIATPGVGSVFGLYVLEPSGEAIDTARTTRLHLAAVARGVYYGTGGEFGVSAALDEPTFAVAAERLHDAIADLAGSSDAPVLLAGR